MIKTLIILLMVGFLHVTFAEAPVLDDPYSATVAVPDQSEAARRPAIHDALQSVISTLSNDPSLNHDSDTSILLEHPEQYVESFSYITDPDQDNGLEIVVHFDRAALKPFFVQAHTEKEQSMNIQISGIASAQDLNAMTQYLKQLRNIQSVSVIQVNGVDVVLSLVLSADENVFLQTLQVDQRLALLNANDGQEKSALRFKWVG